MNNTESTLDALRGGALAGARALKLSGGLTEVPREIFALAETLEVLDLSDNALEALPADFARLTRLRVLFCSNNRFNRLPPVLGNCTALTQVGFRNVGMREVPGEALPPALRWLTLTGNRIEHLPDALGRRPALQKLMLSGNRLSALPEGLAEAAMLELVRLSANRFETLPEWLTTLPRLAWVAWAGNPVDHEQNPAASVAIDWNRLTVGGLLGEGASGRVCQALWQMEDAKAAKPVALKLFKGTMTSDGLPEHEMAACLAAGDHPNLTGTLGRLTGHPEQVPGLVMTLLPEDWRPLAGPPSLESCSRDIYRPDLRLDPAVALRIARGIGAAAAHLHARGLLHGDLYAHNILWDGAEGDARLSDLGAASFLPERDSDAWCRIDTLAWGVLVGELLQRCDPVPELETLHAVQRACVQTDPGVRPSMTDAVKEIGRQSPAC